MQENNNKKNPLIKFNKLKRFSEFVVARMFERIEGDRRRVDEAVFDTDCLNRGDIYTKRDLWEKLDSIADCASLVELRKYDTGEIVIHNANFCHNPVVCPMCADRVSKRRRAIFSKPIERAVRRFGLDEGCGSWQSNWPKGYTGVYMATATIRDGPDLKNRIDILQDSIKRMRKMGQKRKRGRSIGEWSKVRAGIENVEIKIGSGSGMWHVHAHFLIFTDSPIDYTMRDSGYFITTGTDTLFPEQRQVSKFIYEWYSATRGEGEGFDLTPVQFSGEVHGRKCLTFEESVNAQAAEVLKYSTTLSKKKGTSILDAAQYVELIQRRGTRRLFNALGLLRCDKRNPDSFMTISERELRRLEYVDEMDDKQYDIYSSLWQKGGSYSELTRQDGALFPESDDMKTRWINIRRRAFMAQTAMYQGEYRKERNGLFRDRWKFINKDFFENLLNSCRDAFRNRVSSLWENYGDENYLPDFLTNWDSGGMMEYRELHLKLSV